MAIDKLRYFAVVVETKNLRKAAEILGLTPGSLSKAVRSLSDEWGVVLLRPEGRGIEITEAGWRVYRHSIPVLEAHRNMVNALQNESDEASPSLRWGTFEIFSTYFLSYFLDQLESDAPTQIIELTPGHIETALIENRIDFGLTYMPVPHTSLDYKNVGTVPIHVWGHRKWQKVESSQWPFAEPITEMASHAHEEQSLDLWPREIYRQVSYRCQMFETALHLARLGRCVLYCPDHVVKLQNQVVQKDYALEKLTHPGLSQKAHTLNVYLVQRKGFTGHQWEGKLTKAFRALAK